MPPQTRRETQQLENDPSNPDRIDSGAEMYMAFVTATVPVEILDTLIDEVREGVYDLAVDGVPPRCYLCILTIKDLDSIEHGSRKPMQPFESLFLGMTDDEVRSWFNEHRHPDFAEATFAVLDEDTAKNKTCRIGYTDINAKEGEKMITTDFYASIHIRTALEMVTISGLEEEEVRTGNVYTRQRIEEGNRETAKESSKDAIIPRSRRGA